MARKHQIPNVEIKIEKPVGMEPATGSIDTQFSEKIELLERSLQFRIERNEETITRHNTLCEEAREVFAKKNFEYGAAYNLAGAIGAVAEIIGVAAKLRTLVLQDPVCGYTQKESVRNALIDMLNFSVIALITVDDENYNGV